MKKLFCNCDFKGLLGLFLLAVILLAGCGGNNLQSGGQTSGALTPPGPPATVLNSAPGSGVKDGLTFNLRAGWSTVSFPFGEVDSTSGFTYQLYFWDGSQYQWVDPNAGRAGLDPSKGYWAYTLNPSTISVNGSNANPINTITLNPGWNLIAFPQPVAIPFSKITLAYNGETKTLSDAATPETENSSGWVYSMMQYYANSHWYTLNANSLSDGFTPWKAYWVFSWKSGVQLNLVKPFIASLNPSSGSVGDHLTISGFNFGDSAQVTINSATAQVISCADAQIVCQVPDTTSGDVQVSNSKGNSNPVSFTVSQSGPALPIWKKTWGGSDLDKAKAMASDSSGNIYEVGDTFSYNSNNAELYILKYDEDGNLLWQKIWDSDSSAQAVTLDSQGNVIVVGRTTSELLVLKYSSGGSLLWQKIWNSGSGQSASGGVACDSNNNIFVAGTTWAHYDDALLLKLSPDGNLIGNQTWGITQGWDYAMAVAVDQNNQVFVTGSTSVDYPSRPQDVPMLKFDNNCNLLIQKTWGINGARCGCGGIWCDGSNLYVLSDDYSNQRLILLKYDGNLNLSWQKYWGPGNLEQCGGITGDSLGNVYILGGSYAFNPCRFGLAEFSPVGNPLLQKIWDDGTGTVAALAVTPDFNIFLSGVTYTPRGGWLNYDAAYTGDLSGVVSTPSLTCGQDPGSLVDGSGVDTAVSGSTVYSTGADSLLLKLIPDYDFPAAPAISSVSPASGVSGDRVTINGSNFADNGTVVFGGDLNTLALIVSWSGSRIVCTAPSGVGGELSLTVLCGMQASNNDQTFTLPLLPEIDDMSQFSGSPGNIIYLWGNNFGFAKGKVYFGATSVSGSQIMFWNSGMIAVTVPNIPAGSYWVHVQTSAGVDGGPYQFQFTVTP